MPIPHRLAPSKPDERELVEFCTLCDEIEARVLAKEDVSALLARWNARAPRPFAPTEFTTYSGAMDTRVFVASALLPRPAFVPDLTCAELLAVFESVLDGTVGGEAEHSYFIGWLEAQFPDSNISDLIYWPDQWFGLREAPSFELSAAQLARAAMECSGRVLPDAPVVSLPFEVPKRRTFVTPAPTPRQ